MFRAKARSSDSGSARLLRAVFGILPSTAAPAGCRRDHAGSGRSPFHRRLESRRSLVASLTSTRMFLTADA